VRVAFYGTLDLRREEIARLKGRYGLATSREVANYVRSAAVSNAVNSLAMELHALSYPEPTND
jgi:hypothetical protein